MFQFLRTREWAIIRRLLLVIIVLIVAYRTYGDRVMSSLIRANPQRDIEITKVEFRPDIPSERPVWIIGFRNGSRRITYDRIELQASYFDKDGQLLEKDKLVVYQRLDPLQEKTIASADFKQRGAAARGTLAVMTAQQIQ
jgi:hypothetical protein